jgi:N,N'-diacetyllegionaminate synthase
MNIGGRTISPAHPTLVIAEIGVNHDGSLDRALELVHHAKEAGADAVKLQVFRGRTLMHPSAAFAEYQKGRTDAADPIAMLERYELDDAALMRVVEEIRRVGLLPLATPFSLEDVPRVAALDLPAVKIASPDVVNYPLLKQVARLGRPMLLSTGAATHEEVDRATQWLDAWQASFALLHCISAYPVADRHANLCWIRELAERCACPVGYSDHTTNDWAGALAVAGGACIVEKHLTYDRNAVGPDHSASADPHGFTQYVLNIRTAELLRGQPGKRVLDVEQDVRQVSRQSLVTTRDLPEGYTLADADLKVQRPAGGIPASTLPTTVGKRLKRPVPAGTMLTPNDLG